jgi:hypothetical protein
MLVFSPHEQRSALRYQHVYQRILWMQTIRRGVIWTRINGFLRIFGCFAASSGHPWKGVLAGALGFEPRNDGIKTRCLTTWRRPNFELRQIREFAWVIGGFDARFNAEQIANGIVFTRVTPEENQQVRSGEKLPSADLAFYFHSHRWMAATSTPRPPLSLAYFRLAAVPVHPQNR